MGYLGRIRASVNLLIREPILQMFGIDTRQPRGRLVPPDGRFLRSSEYDEIMLHHAPYDGNYGLYEASTYTRSYIYRHRTRFGDLGVWRWRGLYERKQVVLALLEQCHGTIVDLGGAGCPLGFGAAVVDALRRDRCGHKVAFHSLEEVPGPIDLIFACHVLEHVADVRGLLAVARDKLVPGGHLVVLVPSFSNEGWRAGQHSNPRFGRHLWTFGLSTQAKPAALLGAVDLDLLVGEQLTVLEARPVGDDSLFLLGRKQ